MTDEMIDIVDEAHEFVGVASKNLAHRTGLWHYSIHCWIYGSFNDAGFLLFQKRGSDKKLFPDALDISAAGHYQTGEGIEDGVREISEELGIEVAFEDLRDLGIRTEVAKMDGILNREFCRVFLLQTSQRASDFTPDPSEVEGLVEVGLEDGLALFSGEVETVRASGIEYRDGAWEAYSGHVGTESFIPRVDPYYYKMFILASLARDGSNHLAV